MASNEKDSPISLLETLSEIDGNLEYFAVAKDGTTYKCTPAQLKDFVLKGETPVVRIPLAVLNLSNSSSSEDILNAFGGKETFIALCEKIYGRDVVCVCQGFASDDENMKTGYVTQAISCKHIDAENAILMFLINIGNVSHRLMINCVDGTASFSKTTVDDASVILLPDDVNSIEQKYSSKQIFDAFGGKDAYNGYVSKITQKSVIKIGDALYAVSQVLGSSYTDENNSQLVVQTIAMNVIKYIQVTVTGGTAKAIVGKWNIVDAAKILTKDNTTAYTPTQNYHPATKKYVDNIGYGKVINADSGTISNDLIGNGLNLTGVDAEERVNRYFGNLSNFRSVVQDIIENHTRYFIHNSNDCRELGCLNTWKNTGNTEHELHFILTGFGDGNLHTKRYSIRITENTDDARFIIVSIISSNNLTTITKKTAAEYDTIGSKDDNTVYCVTD